jgi:hypothetical protein
VFCTNGFDCSPDAEIDIRSKIDYCVKYKIIPFISEKEENILIITIDILGPEVEPQYREYNFTKGRRITKFKMAVNFRWIDENMVLFD